MYKSLQGCRAIAAILVVLFHLGITIASTKYFGIDAFSIPFSFGTSGVEFFFVLSGFIIFNAHRHDLFQPKKLGAYIKKRLIRIYPTYWIIFGLVFLMVLASSALRNTLPQDLSVLLKSLLLIPQDKLSVGGSGAPVIIVAWTLQYEVLFYLFFALLIFNRWLSIAAGICLLFIYVSYNKLSPFPFSFLSANYVLLFFMGMAIAAITTSNIAKARTPVFYLYSGLLMFVVIALDTVTGLNFFKESSTLLYGSADCLIVLGLVEAEKQARIFLGHSWLQLLGNASYALYLIHFPLVSVLCKLAISLHLDRFGIAGAVSTYIFILLICIATSVVFHLRIEKPIAAYFRRSKPLPP